MKKNCLVLLVILLISIALNAFSQPHDMRGFTKVGINQVTIQSDQIISETTNLFLFDQLRIPVVSVSVSAEIVLDNDESIVRFILVDRNYNEYLVFEAYELLAQSERVEVQDICEETALMEGVSPLYLRVEVTDAAVRLSNIGYSTSLPSGLEIAAEKLVHNKLRHEEKIRLLNQNLRAKGYLWVAGSTDVSELTYAERKKLYGNSTFPAGIEYYAGGILQTGLPLKAATASSMVSLWDWRSRHGKDWITSIKNQASCGSCWAFAATGATEAQLNLYYNQLLNLDLSEQDVLSCSGAGSCAGGYPGTALSYISTTGIVDEAAFSYTATNQPCTNKSTTPLQKIKIAGKVDFGNGAWPASEDNLKKMIIQYGPLSGGIYDWSHAMTLVGWQVVKEGDHFYIRDLNKSTYWITVPAGSPLIGTTVWMFKNSWGTWGDGGYVYIQTAISNIGWTHGLLNPVQSLVQNYDVVCTDNDHDGYYWWGLGSKPVTCTGPETPDGDDSNPNLGPLDAYGNCIELGVPPAADFSADRTSLPANQIVKFTDLSTNAPTFWQWTFEGGNPANSTLRNPEILFPSPGTYSVSLTAGNSYGSSAVTKSGYITVFDPVYCDSKGYAVEEWISSVELGSNVNSSTGSGIAGYQNFTSTNFSVIAGTSLVITLTPKFAGKTKSEYWSAWIDYNGDKDFDDAGELVFRTTARNTGTVSGTVVIPSGLDLSTRMRISMKRNIAPDACEIFTQGEVEDYTLYIRPADLNPLVADFYASPTELFAGGSIQFTDNSTGSPTIWSWSFEGGIPSTSTIQNPVVTYANAGVFNVSLTVSKSGVPDATNLKPEFVIVNPAPPFVYCVPGNINSTVEYISRVVMGSIAKSTGGTSYSLDESVYSFTPGQTYTVALTPFSSVNRNYWRIWIDFNKDGDFTDNGEMVLAINNRKGLATANVVIPSFADGNTRMRISVRTLLAPGPCDDNFSGEVEDYLVNFGASSLSLKEASFNEPGLSGFAGLIVYPNPADRMVTLQLDQVYPADEFALYNAYGSLVKKGLISQNITEVDVSRYSKGIYFIEVIQQGIRSRTKLIVE